MPDITIVKTLRDQTNPSKGHHLEPAGGKLTRVTPGEIVTFRLGDGVLGLTIEFTGATPFGGHGPVNYDQPMKITAAVDADSLRNFYKYSCRTSDGLSSTDGGEMEVVRP
jgi:hypothetical protein